LVLLSISGLSCLVRRGAARVDPMGGDELPDAVDCRRLAIAALTKLADEMLIAHALDSKLRFAHFATRQKGVNFGQKLG